MKFGWVEVPAILWGVEAIYNSVVYNKSVKRIESKLYNAEELTNALNDDIPNINFEKELRDIDGLKKKLARNHKLLNKAKAVSTKIMLAIPFLVIFIFFLNSFSYYTCTVKYEYVPELPVWVVLSFSGYYLFRGCKTAYWVFNPGRELNKIEKALKPFVDRLDPKYKKGLAEKIAALKKPNGT